MAGSGWWGRPPHADALAMDSKLPSRGTIPPDAAGDGALVSEGEASAEGVVVDWRLALAQYLQALQELGDQPAPAASERERPR
jgi:hypothetical protein